MKIGQLAFFVFFSLIVPAAGADLIVGGETVYTVKKGDTLERIGARLGVNWKDIARDNFIDPEKPIMIGQRMRVDARRIVVPSVENGIVINIPDRTLYYFRNGSLVTAFPVGLGKPPRKGSRNWSTPTGKFTIIKKAKNPTWHVPESIQREMMEEGKPIMKRVAPGPDNPLGRFALETSIPGILIHETIWPGSIFQFRSHGCIRVGPEHIEKLFGEVEIGTPGELIYKPVKTALSANGRVFLEVHKDAYGKVEDLMEEARSVIENAGLSGRVDQEKVKQAVQERTGRVEEITR